MNKLTRGAPLIAAAIMLTAGLAMGGAVHAEDRVVVGGTLAADGACPETQVTVLAEWLHRSEDVHMDARLKTGPSSADCRTDSTNYSVSGYQQFPLTDRLAWYVRAAAEHTSVSAIYAEVDAAGEIKRRADGRPAFTAPMAAGAVESANFGVGASWHARPWLRVDTGPNLVQTAWADGSKGYTWHAGLHADRELRWGRLEASLTADVGRDVYGDARLAWTVPVLGPISVMLSGTYDYGLNAQASDAPDRQVRDGRAVRLAGPPQDDALAVTIAVAWES